MRASQSKDPAVALAVVLASETWVLNSPPTQESSGPRRVPHPFGHISKKEPAQSTSKAWFIVRSTTALLPPTKHCHPERRGSRTCEPRSRRTCGCNCRCWVPHPFGHISKEPAQSTSKRGLSCAALPPHPPTKTVILSEEARALASRAAEEPAVALAIAHLPPPSTP